MHASQHFALECNKKEANFSSQTATERENDDYSKISSPGRRTIGHLTGRKDVRDAVSTCKHHKSTTAAKLG